MTSVGIAWKEESRSGIYSTVPGVESEDLEHDENFNQPQRRNSMVVLQHLIMFAVGVLLASFFFLWSQPQPQDTSAITSPPAFLSPVPPRERQRDPKIPIGTDVWS